MISIMLSVHIVVSLLIGGLGILLKKDKIVGIITLCICLFLPIGGYIFSLFFLLRRTHSTREIEEDYFEEEMLLFTDRLQSHNTSLVVPIEETLLVNSNEVKRQKISEILKEDPFQYIDILQMALRDKDIETSHYASSAISEVKRKLNLQLQKFNTMYMENSQDTEFLTQYARLLQTYLTSKLVDTHSYKRYAYLYFEVLTKLVGLSPNKQNYKDLIESCFLTNQLDKAALYSEQFLSAIECEESFISRLKYFYSINDHVSFQGALDKLRSSKVSLSREGLELIRFWLEEKR